MPRVIRAGTAILAAAMFLEVGAALGAPQTAWDPNPYSVIGAESIAPFFAAARERRVDIAIISDSNTRFFSVSGHEDGMARAFTARHGCYATRVDPVAGVASWEASTFMSYSAQWESITTDAPPDLASSSLPFMAGFPATYAYLGWGQTLGQTNNTGLGIQASHPIGIDGPLRWHLTHYLFPGLLQAIPRRPGHAAPPIAEPYGFFSPTCREQWPGSAWNNHVAARVQTVDPLNVGFTDWHMDVPPGERSPHGVLFCLTNYADGQDAVGPFYARWTRVENLDRTTGVAYSPLLYQGGQTTRHAASSLLDAADQAKMTEWFRQITRLQNGPPVLLIQIIQGANDANFDTPAIVYNRGDTRPPEGWPAGAAGNTRLGLKQNFMSVINRLRDYWAGAGYDESNLYFLIGSYHPHPPSWNGSGPDATDGLQYRVIREEAAPAWREICLENQNIAMVDGWQLSSPEEFIANSWYRFTSPYYNDHAHLSIAGYRAWGEAVAEAVKRACECGPSIDFDFNGRREVADIFTFLSLWFAGDARANFDRAGDAPTVPDIFAFLAAWFAGCAGH